VKATPLVEATPDAMARRAEIGLTDVITVTWYFSGGDPHGPRHQLDSVAWYAEEVISPFRDLDPTP